MVKTSSSRTNKTSNKTSTKKGVTSRTKRGAISKMARSTKRYGKQTLRDLLLSKTFHTSFKVLVGLMISASALYGSYAFIGNTFANDVVVSKSEILSRVSKHVQLPTEAPDAVVRVQDAGVLKKQNDFYVNVKEGDYIIMYTNIAVIYDLRNDSIVALKRTER
ncbi:MAG: hypothetical protein WCT07_01110 [Candidatus Paceibacterota bacterium]|jgi:hypothetical protein